MQAADEPPKYAYEIERESNYPISSSAAVAILMPVVRTDALG